MALYLVAKQVFLSNRFWGWSLQVLYEFTLIRSDIKFKKFKIFHMSGCLILPVLQNILCKHWE